MAARPEQAFLQKEPTTLAEHLRQHRFARQLIQREAAAEIGVSEGTYHIWETGKGGPDLRHIPSVISFLGYDWRPIASDLGSRLRHVRTENGLSIAELARLFGIDATTVQKWESGMHRPTRRLREVVDEWLFLHLH